MIQKASEQAKNKTKNRKILQESHDHVMSSKCKLQQSSLSTAIKLSNYSYLVLRFLEKF